MGQDCSTNGCCNKEEEVKNEVNATAPGMVAVSNVKVAKTQEMSKSAKDRLLELGQAGTNMRLIDSVVEI